MGPRARKASPEAVAALTALYRSGDHKGALAAGRTLAISHPATLAAWNIRGVSALALDLVGEAEESFRALEELDPAFAGAPYNLGMALERLGRVDEAIAAYRRALACDPSLAQARNNLGSALTRVGESAGAIAELEQALSLAPAMAEVHNNLGNALKLAGQPEAARNSYRDALALRPDFVAARYNLAVLEQDHGDIAAALAEFGAVLEQAPDHALARLRLIQQLAHHCDWDALGGHQSAIPALGVDTEPLPPFALLALEDNPARQLLRARRWTELRYPVRAATIAPPQSAQGQPLRIAYFSADFHDHPMMELLPGLLRAHDRKQFEVHIFSHGAKRDDHGRRRAEAQADHFHDVAGWPDHAIVERARARGIAIAIEHDGYTSDSRTGLFAHRLAPVQINFLGYPGTLGAGFFDYIVTDPVLVPDAQRGFLREVVIRLPHCYQPNDRERAIAPLATTRADHGLPDGALVLACFNASYKITARAFDIWMRVMREVPDSVLWLLRSNAVAPANLAEQAARRGVDPARLVFAERLPSPQHLARHAHADLFVDTFAVNAHTTAADALWAGLPLVTRAGEQFAARVAASVLTAAGIGELVTSSDAEYEALILALAQDPMRLAQVRAKLAANRLTTPLFDTAQYARHFEAGLLAAYGRSVAGAAPADIHVAA